MPVYSLHYGNHRYNLAADLDVDWLRLAIKAAKNDGGDWVAVETTNGEIRVYVESGIPASIEPRKSGGRPYVTR